MLKRFPRPSLTMANICLGVVVATLLAEAVREVSSPTRDVRRIVAAVSRLHVQPVQEKIETIKPLDFYQREMAKRDIFQPYLVARKKPVVVKAPHPPKKPVEPGLADLVRGFVLVGIAWGDRPEAMIKDGKTNETYFVRQGQRVGTSKVTVKSIHKDKVVVKYKDEEMEL